MIQTAVLPWHEANQRYLAHAVARVRTCLDLRAAEPAASPAPPAPGAAPGPHPDGPFALDALCGIFALTPFERDVLLLSAGLELDPTFAAGCAAAQGDARRTYPTFGLALAALPAAHWSAFTPSAPLRSWRLVELTPGDSLLTSPLRIDERILHFLAGVSCVDDRLQSLLTRVPPPETLAPAHAALAERLAQAWLGAGAPDLWPVAQLCGPEQAGKESVAAAAAAAFGAQVWRIDAADLPTAPQEREALARLWEREAALVGGVLLVEAAEAEADRRLAAAAFVDGVRTRVAVAAPDPLRLRRRTTLRLDVPKPSPAEQLALWEEALGPPVRSHAAALTTQFNLGLRGVQTVAAHVRSGLQPTSGPDMGELLWAACREQARPRMDDLAQRIEAAADWSDLILPEAQRQTMQEIAAHVRRRAQVYGEWGFATKGVRGLGISALFAGGSGTGKTMAAEVLAAELRLDLYRIDLSAVVSKYIGETEKNLRRVFDAAEEGGVVLLFDEADALFGKRSEVKDSHDRYANIEVGYLLQRMEAYRGLAILTTNMKNALDTAFLRRIRFVVQFPFPDAAQRAEIWRRIFPAGTPTEGLDYARLAQLGMAGGNIRNIALGAAFLAADAGAPVRMAHILRAARAEYAKVEKTLTAAEIGGWM